MQSRFDAVIVGAGPAGSSAAILLARAGWSVALVEKQQFPRRKVCGECVAASNLPLLAALGIEKGLASLAGPELCRVAILRGDREAVANLPAASDQRYRWGRTVGRETLDTLLLDQARAAGATVMAPWSVLTLKGSLGEWRCEARAIESRRMLTLSARVVIAAHGSWEVLPPDRARRQVAHCAADLLAFKASFRNASVRNGVLSVLSFDGGYGGMVDSGGGSTTVACCIRRDRLEAARQSMGGLPAGDVVEALLKQECSGVRASLGNAVREGQWLAAGPLNPGVRLRSSDAIFSIGNAAGEAHPILGEGMSMALQSAALLSARLLDTRHTDVFDRERLQHVGHLYATDWRRAFVPRLWLASAFAHLAMRRATAAPLIAVARLWPGFLTRAGRWGGKVHCAADLEMITALTHRLPRTGSPDA